jgi:hypothetical protein
LPEYCGKSTPRSTDEAANAQARLVLAMAEVMEAMAAGRVWDREALLPKYGDVAQELSERCGHSSSAPLHLREKTLPSSVSG